MNTRLVAAVLFVLGVAVNTVTATTGFTNNTSTPLTATVSATGCGSTKYCGFQPSSCNPATSGCYFASAKQGNSGLLIELSGNSMSYIAAAVSPNNTFGNNVTTYICAYSNDNTTVDYYTALLNSTALTLSPANLSVNSVNGTVNGSVIQCTINVTATNAAFVNIYNGTYNKTAGELGNAVFLFQLNLTSPLNSNSNTTGNTTGSTTAPSYGTALQQSLTQALLITAAVLGLTMM